MMAAREASAYTTARLTGATVRLDVDQAGDAADCATSCRQAERISTRP